MSATMCRLEWAVTVSDVEQWTPEHVLEADSDMSGGGYDDWVVNQLRDMMHDAGEQFIQENPDLFRVGLT